MVKQNDLLNLQREGSGKGRKRQRAQEKDTPVAQFVRNGRTRQKLTQSELAGRVGVALSTLRDIEQGKDSIKISTLNLVLLYFGSQAGVIDLIYIDDEG